MATQPDSSAAAAYTALAESVWAQLQQGDKQEGRLHGTPKITFE